jgi:hypothetical protein
MVIIMEFLKKKNISLALSCTCRARHLLPGPQIIPKGITRKSKKGDPVAGASTSFIFHFFSCFLSFSCPLSSPHAYHDCSRYQRRRLSHAAKLELLTLCSHSHSQKNGIVEYQEREVKNFFELAGSQKWCAHESRHQRSYFQLHAESFGIIISSFLVYVLVLETSWSFKTNAIPRYPI